MSSNSAGGDTLEEKVILKDSPIMEAYHSIDATVKHLSESIRMNNQPYLNPMILLQFCQLKSAVTILAFELGVGLNFMSCFENPDDPGNDDHATRMDELAQNGGLSAIVYSGVAALNAEASEKSTSSDLITSSKTNRSSLTRSSDLSALRGSLEKFRSLKSLNLNSIKAGFSNMMGFSSDEARLRSNSSEFQVMMLRAMKNPDTLQSRIWMLLEAPSSSKQARALQLLLLFLICVSIFVLYTETMITLGNYGENSGICGSTLEYYCADKFNVSMDPGCFVFGSSQNNFTRLRFQCDDKADCFGVGQNFGSLNESMTCGGSVSPFQDFGSLTLKC